MKQLIKATLMFIMSLSLFTAVVYAWFSVGDHTVIQPISATLSDGSAVNYEIKYYTKNNVYKYDVNTNQVLVYQASTGTYVPQSSLPINHPTYSFTNMFLHEYDPIIPENNYEKNVIVEISMALIADSLTIRNSIISDKDLSTDVVSLYPYSTSRPYYVSEAAQIQTLISKDYNNYQEGSNKYTALSTVFNSVDVNQNLIYPLYNFYQNDEYSPVLNLGSTQLTSDVSSYKLYYNFTYYDSKIDEFLAYENMMVDVDNMSFMVFFPDIKFSIVIGGNV